MEEAATEIVESTPVDAPLRRRVDPRTGKEMLCHPRSFWEEHERQRIASGVSISRYCEQHGLALSTLRRWSAQIQGRGTRRTQKQAREAKTSTSPSGFLSVPIVSAQNEHVENARDARYRIEVLTRSGARVRLFDETAERVLQMVMAELASPR